MKCSWLSISAAFIDRKDSEFAHTCRGQRFLKFHNQIGFSAFFLIFSLFFYLSGCGHRHIPLPLLPPSTPVRELPATQHPYKVNGHVYYPLPSAEGFVEEGYASWYGKKFHGRPTASGEPYNMYAITAAHRTLPMNTYVRVLNLENGREVVTRISDRGPFAKKRIIDLSYGAGRKLGLIGPGTAKVRIEALGEVRLGAGKPAVFKSHPDFRRGKFYIQIGAFLKPDNAYALRRKMTRYYKNVVVFRQPRGDQTFYRVQVFAATEYNTAKDFETRLESSGFPEAFVVAR
ncbi:MAG: septal ring lytic transglycosylase RlpA family protein [Deltaproteobacteria bacterium]|nr:septal ring lytic transglycosylase RlpA family protein [Deltaproteobacteria bacterium]